jgi:hypothetical protein
MPVGEAATPADGLHRIGRFPDPLVFPPWSVAVAKTGRFDDPRDEFRVLYAAAQRIACFVETLAPFRPRLAFLNQIRGLPDGERGDDLPRVGAVPSGWHRDRLIGRLLVLPGQRWLDLRHHETILALRQELSGTLVALGLDDFDLSTALSANRRLTQATARWAYEHGFQGIAYASRHGADLECWALFEGARFEPVEIAPVVADDPDLVVAAGLLGLSVIRHDV